MTAILLFAAGFFSFSAFGQETHEACLRRFRLLSEHSSEVDRLAGKAEREQLANFLERIRPGIFGPPGKDSTASVRNALIQNAIDFPFGLVILKSMPSSNQWTIRHLVQRLPIHIVKKGSGKDAVSKGKTYTTVSVDFSSTTVLLRAAFEFPQLVVGIVGKDDNVLENPEFNYRLKAPAEKKLVETWMDQLKTASSGEPGDIGPIFASYARRILEHRFGAKP